MVLNYEFLDRNRLKTIFRITAGQISEWVGENILDPIFDQEKEELAESERFLRKFYVETNRFVVENVVQKNRIINNNLFKIWKESIGKLKIENSPKNPVDFLEISQIMQASHIQQFNKLLRNGKLENFVESKKF